MEKFGEKPLKATAPEAFVVLENDKRHAKDVSPDELAALALNAYLEGKAPSARVWQGIGPDDPRFLELRRQIVEIVEKAVHGGVSGNLFVPRVVQMMQTQIVSVASQMLKAR